MIICHAGYIYVCISSVIICQAGYIYVCIYARYICVHIYIAIFHVPFFELQNCISKDFEWLNVCISLAPRKSRTPALPSTSASTCTKMMSSFMVLATSVHYKSLDKRNDSLLNVVVGFDL